MKKVAIIGAGISGLFIANLFKRNKKYQVNIFERNSLINSKEGYGIQLSVNSIKLLNKIQFDKLENSEKFNPDKINFYSVKNSNKICELNISDFNTENCKYTTLKRSSLINFLKKDLEKEIKFDHTISKIEQQNQIIKISFENNEIYEFDYLIISDGVFSKSKNLLSKNSLFKCGTFSKIFLIKLSSLNKEKSFCSSIESLNFITAIKFKSPLGETG